MDSPVPFLNVAYLYQKLYELLSGQWLPQGGSFIDAVFHLIDIIRPFSVLLSLLFLTGILYATIRTGPLSHQLLGHGDDHGSDGHGHADAHGGVHSHGEADHAHAVVGHGTQDAHGGAHEADNHTHGTATASPDTHGVVVDPFVNKRWQKIQQHIHSTNQSDWRFAILECDIVLDEMLTKMGYHGETVSDKLKAVERSDFLTIDKAWEAHRVRNAIAHEGASFDITEREAMRVVGLYMDVFKEFHFI